MPPRPRSRALVVGLLTGAIVGGAVLGGVLVQGVATSAVPDDPWAHDYSAAAYAARLADLDGSVRGVGLRLRIDRDALVVADVDRDGPAYRAGVRVGERVVALDGRDVDASDLADVVTGLRRGDADATVQGPSGTRNIALKAAPLPSRTVSVRTLSSGTRLVEVEAMARDAAESVDARLNDLGAGPEGGVILDLRGNGGGLVTEAVDLAGVFVDGGPGIAYPRPDGSWRSLDLVASGEPVTAPLVVLVDGRTASAAEIAAGILQDRGRAVVIGAPTFGKGTVQEPSLAPDGTVRERTVGRYVLPSGRQIDGRGITPDVVVDAQAPESTVMSVAASVLKGLAPTTPEGR